jgi:hypothetical protein
MAEIKHIPGDRRAEPVIRDIDGDWTPAPFWMQAWPVLVLIVAGAAIGAVLEWVA